MGILPLSTVNLKSSALDVGGKSQFRLPWLGALELFPDAQCSKGQL